MRAHACADPTGTHAPSAPNRPRGRASWGRGRFARADHNRADRAVPGRGLLRAGGRLPASEIEALRGECRRLIDERDAEMDRLGVDTIDLDHRGSRYFLHAYGKSGAFERFLFSEVLARIARSALGDTVYLFNEQYVVKAAERGMKFGWHQDSASSRTRTGPISPAGSRSTTSTRRTAPSTCSPTRGRAAVEHFHDAETNDLIGYFGDDPGDPVIVPAGSIASFSSTLFHRSGANTNDQVRRIYLAQYSAEPILSDDGSRPRHLAEPFVVEGERVSERP